LLIYAHAGEPIYFSKVTYLSLSKWPTGQWPSRNYKMTGINELPVIFGQPTWNHAVAGRVGRRGGKDFSEVADPKVTTDLADRKGLASNCGSIELHLTEIWLKNRL
jgi:hypothetical protein